MYIDMCNCTYLQNKTTTYMSERSKNYMSEDNIFDNCGFAPYKGSYNPTYNW